MVYGAIRYSKPKRFSGSGRGRADRHGRVCAADVLEDPLEHLEQERAGAAGEVQDGHALVVGEALGISKLSFRMSSIARTMKFTIGGGVRSTPRSCSFFVVGPQVVLGRFDERVALEQAVLLLVRCADLAVDGLATPERQVFVNGRQV